MRYRTFTARIAGALSCALILAAVQAGTQTLQAGAPPASPLLLGKAKLAKGQTQQAVQLLEAAVKAAPTSCEAHLCLGQAYLKGKNYTKAREHLRSAVRYGRGSANAQKANTCLMTLPKNMVRPRCGPGTAMIARTTGIMSLERGAEESKPTVIDFYASWANPCKLLKPSLEKAKAQYGERVNFLMVNVDDPNSDDIVEKYDVSPVPTLVFLKPDGEVATYSIGYSGDQEVSKGIAQILPSG
jgi:thioredoxin-like negative regulator of GroEL